MKQHLHTNTLYTQQMVACDGLNWSINWNENLTGRKIWKIFGSREKITRVSFVSLTKLEELLVYCSFNYNQLASEWMANINSTGTTLTSGPNAFATCYCRFIEWLGVNWVKLHLIYYSIDVIHNWKQRMFPIFKVLLLSLSLSLFKCVQV